MIKTFSEQSYFQDYKDVIILKFVESTVWLALRFRERKLIFLSWSVSLEKNFLKQPENLPQVSAIRVVCRSFFLSGCGKICPKDTQSFSVFNMKKTTTKAHFKKWRTNTWHSTRQSIMFSPGPCLRLARLIFREFIYFFHQLGKEQY